MKMITELRTLSDEDLVCGAFPAAGRRGTGRERKRRLHGHKIEIWPDGTRRAEWHYIRGLRHGPSATWHPTGRVDSDGEWREGLPHGLFQRWWQNARPMVHGYFEHGKPTGNWRIRDEEGHVIFNGPWRESLLCWLPDPFREAIHGRRRQRLAWLRSA